MQLHYTGREEPSAHSFVRDVMLLQLTRGETNAWYNIIRS